MALMNMLERLAYWKSVAIEAARAQGRGDVAALEARTWKDEDDLFAFFDCFRPDGTGVEKIFAGVVGGEEIIPRLLRVFECTGEGFKRDMYFIVRRPVRATPDTLTELTAKHLDKIEQIAIDHVPELASLFQPRPRIEITSKPPPQRTLPDYEAPETVIYDAVGDWFSELEPDESDALLLGEAFYSIACDYNIARYLLWPLYQQSTDIEEPFAPYFELWTRGARPWFERPGQVIVYVAGDS